MGSFDTLGSDGLRERRYKYGFRHRRWHEPPARLFGSCALFRTRILQPWVEAPLYPFRAERVMSWVGSRATIQG